MGGNLKSAKMQNKREKNVIKTLTNAGDECAKHVVSKCNFLTISESCQFAGACRSHVFSLYSSCTYTVM